MIVAIATKEKLPEFFTFSLRNICSGWLAIGSFVSVGQRILFLNFILNCGGREGGREEEE